MDRYLGIDIGGTKIAVVMARLDDDRPVMEGRREIPTDDVPKPEVALRAVGDLAAELSARHGNPRSAGVSCGGPLDSRRGLVLSPPNLPGWNEVPVVKILGERLQVPVRLMNDADAGAIAEHRFGAGRGTDNMVFLTFGTGIGAGLILNGRVYEGTTNGAGEIGHVRLDRWGPVGYGKIGSVEGFCSGGGIAQLAEMFVRQEAQAGRVQNALYQHTVDRTLNAKVVFQAAATGDPLARTVVEHVAASLGRSLAILVDILNPQRIVLGGIFTRAEGALRDGLEWTLGEEAIPANAAACSVVAAALGERIGDYAALSVALEQMR